MAKAQTMFAADVNGSPIKVTKYTNINGSPYLSDSWQKGTVLLANGQTFNLDIKYDMIADNLLFKNKNGDSLNFVQPVKEFKIKSADNDDSQSKLFRNGFPSTNVKTSASSFYEVLYDGGTKLLKREAKSLWKESTTYATATETQNITQTTDYYIFKDGKMITVKPNKKAFLSALSNKTAELGKYVKDNNIDFKKDSDLIKVVSYYNSL
ncbi:hypothetical protein [Mucilaginibacter sp. KACC 22063]|uniref:hypothetical protein n=1 Tax=Mucilaginibacter sp. KACC 22063 TaxID=3025666 RepID=UPI002366F2C5|nr:hypothetical protein [Mucilaginibacter sp. KACC 22063]WDF55271.1 hypothetical protein PQ461_20270 [Mucilaginibacter sp. KACC 22063]